MSDVEALAYEDVLARIGELAEQLTVHPDPAVAERVGELLDWVDAFHRDGLGQLVEMIRAWRGEIFLESVAGHPVTGALLAAYGLGEGPEQAVAAATAVAAALEEVRPLVESHGGSIEVETIQDGIVTVRLAGTCDGCPSSSATLTYGVEVALREHWPHFRRLEVVDPAETADASKADLVCVTAPQAAPAPTPTPTPQPALLQIRGHEGR